jgi:hypothetical protein
MTYNLSVPTEGEEINEMHAQVSMGDKFKTWAGSDEGRYILGRAEQYELATLRDLADCPISDQDRLLRLQSESKIPGLLMSWIEEIINEGEVAKFQLATLAGD